MQVFLNTVTGKQIVAKSLASTANLTFLTAVLIADLADECLTRAFSFVTIRLICDFMFAMNLPLSISFVMVSNVGK